jgi:sortase A
VNLHSSTLRFAQRLLLAIGFMTLLYVGSTVAYASIYQQYEVWKFDRAAEFAPIPEPDVPEEQVELHEGDVIGKLEIPRIGITVMVLHGLEESTLIRGAGHVPGTPRPGGEGNVVIAAHRDTYFRKMEGIVAGDRIEVATKDRTYVYIVDSMEIVSPENTEPMESRGRSELTFITCYPFYFVGAAPKRFIVHAHPVNFVLK